MVSTKDLRRTIHDLAAVYPPTDLMYIGLFTLERASSEQKTGIQFSTLLFSVLGDFYLLSSAINT
jgi:hypothetical protein